VHVVMGQFSFEMQYLLDDFMSGKQDQNIKAGDDISEFIEEALDLREGKTSLEKLMEVYEDVGTEGHNIENMTEFLELA
jgi:hypothetical protein